MCVGWGGGAKDREKEGARMDDLAWYCGLAVLGFFGVR